MNARLVKVDTREVLLADKFVESMGDKFFTRVNEMADRMAMSVSGDVSGFLTIDSTPQGADVRVGDRSIGVTPLVQKKMKPGKYNATLVKEGCDLKAISFEVTAEKTTIMKEMLTVKSDARKKYHLSLFAHPLPLYSQDYLMDFGASLDAMLYDFSLGVDLGGNYLSHKYEDKTAPGKTFSQEMKLLFFRFDAYLRYNILADNPFISPYIGGAVGLINVDSKEYNIQMMSFYYNGVVGLTFFPTGKMSVYTELMYQDLGKLTIKEKQFNLFGDYTLNSKDIPLRNFLVGFGLRFVDLGLAHAHGEPGARYHLESGKWFYEAFSNCAGSADIGSDDPGAEPAYVLRFPPQKV